MCSLVSGRLRCLVILWSLYNNEACVLVPPGQLFGPGILPHHCNLMHADGLVTVTPVTLDAETFVDGQRISDTTVLRSGMTLQFGAAHVFKFVDPSYDHGLGMRDPGGMVKGRHKSG